SAKLSPCETIIYQATVGFRGGTDCAFENGTITITTPDGVAHDVTPAGGVPKLGGTGGVASVPSQTVSYQVRSQDIVGGKVTASSTYGAGASGTPIEHTGPGTDDTMGQPTGSTAFPLTVQPCPVSTDCIMNMCDAAATDGTRTGLCTTMNKPDSTICTDTDGNLCTTAGCDGQGNCDQNHVVKPCTVDECNI